MRGVFYVLSAFAVIGLAIWAYDQNDRTQRAMKSVRELRREIHNLNEALGVQHAEWAYLNRPERLRALVDMNAMRLGLVPLTGAQFGRIDEIAYPMLLARTEGDL
ncbi:cell division protein FtsL [Pararhodobacter sp.]|uniref:cell division protein FtsL n=1 Tax=Pararhodobacter sp. TaxID=2127056 RepID=UPI002AFF1CF1|nr:cell division protein FtsL [Pararhodobacter sp.]